MNVPAVNDVNPPGLWRESADLPPIIHSVRPFTMVPHAALVDLARMVRVVVEQEIPGAMVECGAWKGGASFLMASVLREARASSPARKVWMFDSFEGIQPPEAIDGPAADAWARDKDGRSYHNNLRAPLDDVYAAARSLGVAEGVEPVKGWFDKTLPVTRERIGPIALLRIDADWHSSVKCCLDQLYDQVVDGGLIVFDDYYTWDGCAVAVHEFLGTRQLAHRIETIGYPEPVCAVFRKGGVKWAWLREQHLLGQDLIALSASHAGRIVIVDDDALRSRLPKHLPLLPFLERDGIYFGAPSDSASAIAEVEKVQLSGADAIVFAWISFWWLDHYAEFAAHLRKHYRCVLQNDRAIAFVRG